MIESGRISCFVLMITRLVPLFPYNLQNFAYGVTDIGFGTYTVGSFLFMLPGNGHVYQSGRQALRIAGNRMLYLGIAVVIVGSGCFGIGTIILKTKYVDRRRG